MKQHNTRRKIEDRQFLENFVLKLVRRKMMRTSPYETELLILG